MPTPALRATASRLASGPPALNTAFAASSTRSRLRAASAGGFRVLVLDGFIPVIRSFFSVFARLIPCPLGGALKSGGVLRIFIARHADTQAPRQANGCEAPSPPQRLDSP